MKRPVIRTLIIGLIMGLMLPFMVHETGTSGALWFVAAHAVVIAALALLALWATRYAPRIRAMIPAHRPSKNHVAFMASGIALGWGMICLFGLALYLTGAM